MSTNLAINQTILDKIVKLYPDITNIIPLTPLQQGLYFESLSVKPNQKDPYHVYLLIVLKGKLNSEAMQRAWGRLVQRHDLLRMVYAPSNLAPGMAIIRGKKFVAYEKLEFCGTKEEQLNKLRSMHSSFNFDMESGPLIKLFEADIGTDEVALLFSHHHSILDGWSLPILTNELASLYISETTGRSPGLEPVFEWTDHLEWLKARDIEGAKKYWKDYFNDLQAPSRLNFGVDKKHERQNKTIVSYLDPITNNILEDFAHSSNLTVASIFQGLFGLLLCRLTGQSEIVIGSVRNGRSSALPRIDKGLGLFINTLPLYIRMDNEISLSEWLGSYQTAMIEQDQHGFLGLRQIQKLGGFSGADLFEAMFVYTNYPQSSNTSILDHLKVVKTETLDGNHYPIGLVLENDETLRLVFTYNTGYISADMAQQTLSRLMRLVKYLPKIKYKPLGSILITDTEEAASLKLISRGLSENIDPKSSKLPFLFCLQAERTPDSVALIFEDQSLTYGELDRRSNQLARYLISEDVGPDDIVAILLDRSFEMIIAMLGVLKAGGAYLPLDPEYPSARLNFMIEDSEAKYIITSQDHSDTLGLDNQVSRPRIDLSSSILLEQLQKLSDLPVAQAERVSPLHSEHLAYLIYTSGSTGRPKGAALPHKGLANYLLWALVNYPSVKGRPNDAEPGR